MASIPSSGWTLQTSTDTSNDTTIVIHIPREKLSELKDASSLQLITGKTSSIRYGKQSLKLTLKPEHFVNELYHRSSDHLNFYSNATYQAQITQPVKDDALLALEQSLAEYSDQKKASSIHVANAILPEPKNRFEAARQSKSIQGITKNLGSSPSSITSQRPAPTSAYYGAPTSKTKALRHAVIHLLAMQSLPIQDIAAKVRIPVQELRGVLQTSASLVEGKWKILDKACKELNIWSFKYPTRDNRQAAIDTAIRAYDRLRLSRDDKLWQLLLPKAERGQGKVLSRLDFSGGSGIAAALPRITSPQEDRTPSAAGSPHLTSQGTPNSAKKNAVIDRLLSKDPRKARAEVLAKDKKRKERESADNAPERPVKRQAITKKAAGAPNNNSAEFVYSSGDDDAHCDSKTPAKSAASDHKASTRAKVSSHVKASEPRINTLKDIKKTPPTHSLPKATTASKSTGHPNGTASAKAHISPPKALRPTVPSPLGASTRPRVASDVSDRSGISQRRSNGVETPRGLGITSTPRKRHDTVTSVDTDRPKQLHKSAMASQQDRVSQRSKLSDTTHMDSHHNASSTSSQDRFDGGSSDSSTSVVDTITFSQGVDLAMKFQEHYYPQYAKLYDSLERRQQDGEVVDSNEIKKLLEMHNRLQQMKSEIEAASQRQRAGNDS